MPDLSQYFGKHGPFSEAADLYGDRQEKLPLPILVEAEELGDPKCIGYAMGYAFALVLHRRNLTISSRDLEIIGREKVPLGGPEPFVAGFKRFPL